MALIDFASDRGAGRRGEALEAVLLWLVVYPPCLMVALASRPFGRRPEGDYRPGILAEAKASAAACVAFVFR